MPTDEDFAPLSPSITVAEEFAPLSLDHSTMTPTISSLFHLFPSEDSSSSEHTSQKMARLLSLLQEAVNVKASIADFNGEIIEADPESARQFGTLVWILAGGEAGEYRVRKKEMEIRMKEGTKKGRAELTSRRLLPFAFDRGEDSSS